MRPQCSGYLCLFLLCSSVLPATSQILINEYVASNQTGLEDEFGSCEDWIELYNVGPTTVDLAGAGLSDDELDPFRWIFPHTLIDGGEFLVVFASGRDLRYWINHWETIITEGDSWRYLVGTAEPPADWRTIDFDDSTWSAGPSGFGYGDGDDATIVPPTISLYLRHTFQIDSPEAVREIYLHVDFDDGFVAYLNDIEVTRSNIGVPGDHPPFDQTTYIEHEAEIYQGGHPLPCWIQEPPPAELLHPGTNVLAIQVHNVALDSDDMSLIPFLTLGLDEPPAAPAGVPEILQLFIDNLHTNFRISSEGERLTLTNAGGELLDQIDSGPMCVDISRGRSPGGSPDWYFFDQPTPYAANTTPGYLGFAPTPELSPPAGHYAGILTVAAETTVPEATIHLTQDGADPTTASPLYTIPVPVTATAVLRARAFQPGHLPGPIVTQTYLVDESSDMPIISLATDPPNLWDELAGIYVEGPNANPYPPHEGANYWQDWERPVHLEYFTVSGELGLDLDAGVKIHGHISRIFAQKSLRILTRGHYGTEVIDYPLFAERAITDFKRLVLRNAGTDWRYARLRDALIERLAAGTDLDRMAFEPTGVFLNGAYWGIHNLRERLDEHYLASHHGVDPDAVEILESLGIIIEGSSNHWIYLRDFIATHDLSEPENYAIVETLMEIDNFIEYNVFEIYAANTDWPHHNVKYWRPATPAGRWRWFLLDFDEGLGIPNHPTLEIALLNTSSNLLLHNLMANEAFKHRFINWYADRLNTTFTPENLGAVFDEVRQSLEQEMPRHVERWDFTLAAWYENLQIVENFITQRPAHARAHLLTELLLDDTLILSLDIEPPEAGGIELTAIAVDSTWSGTYFLGVPISARAVPAPGFTFGGWSDPTLPPEPAVLLTPAGNYQLTAHFVPADGDVLINEINYNSAAGFDPEDWVEFHNSSTEEIEISGWRFRDAEEEHVFTFPTPTTIQVGGYLVLCRDQAAFTAHFPAVTNFIGDLDFGFSGDGELLRLFDATEELRDWVEYDDEPPWPPEPDGQGPTLELLRADLNNSLPASWLASLAPHGTPGATNSVTTGIALPDGEATSPAPRVLRLDRPAPSPCGASTRLAFEVPAPTHAQVTIYDASGRLVRRLLERPVNAGRYVLIWDGRDQLGRTVASGVYFARLSAGDRTLSRKLQVLR